MRGTPGPGCSSTTGTSGPNSLQSSFSSGCVVAAPFSSLILVAGEVPTALLAFVMLMASVGAGDVFRSHASSRPKIGNIDVSDNHRMPQNNTAATRLRRAQIALSLRADGHSYVECASNAGPSGCQGLNATPISDRCELEQFSPLLLALCAALLLQQGVDDVVCGGIFIHIRGFDVAITSLASIQGLAWALLRELLALGWLTVPVSAAVGVMLGAIDSD
jgi:hypothetical protein